MTNDIGSFFALCCQAAPSADNSQPFHVDWQSPKLTLRYDAVRVSGRTFDSENQATQIAAGCAIENVEQMAAHLGLRVEVSYLPKKRGGTDVFAEIFIHGDIHKLAKHIEHPIFLRHTNRFAFEKRPLPSAVLQALDEKSEAQAGIHVLSRQESIRGICQQVRSAAEIRFQTREVHEWLAMSLRYTESQVMAGDGLDVRTLDLPPGGGGLLRFISSWQRMKLLNRIGGHKMLAAIDSWPIKNAPAVLAFVAPDNAQGAVEAGRLLNRAWIYLNSKGIACHPYYVISDQLARLKENAVPGRLLGQAEKLKAECKQLLGLKENETLMMLLRIGYPVREAPRSRRLPLCEVFTDLSGAAQ